MSNNRILVIEDEKPIARFVELELQHEGYQVDIAFDGREGLRKVEETWPDLVLLDVMLPELDGMEVCRQVRQFSQVPIIMLTARDQTSDKVRGLDLGADDYVSKLAPIEELLARIRAALRKSSIQRSNAKTLVLDDLLMETEHHIVKRAEHIVELTKREYDLLEYLLVNREIVLSREQILENVWGYDFMGDTNIVDVYIRYLRSKIDEPFPSKLIHTVRGVGYVLKEDPQ